MSDKPHLVLDWILNVPTQELSCTINENLKYIAHKGGTEGYTKLERESNSSPWQETFIPDIAAWSDEKLLISKLYGNQLGYYQPDETRYITHPTENRPDRCANGVGPDGRYLDHMQRLQVILEGKDVVEIYLTDNNITFLTPDGGKTILKAIPIPIEDTHYKNEDDKRDWRPAHPQPCMMQPTSPGRLMSSYEEMEELNVPKSIIDKCKNGEWRLPDYPKLFTKYYIY